MELEEELLLKNLGWEGKGLIKSACDAANDGSLHVHDTDGNSNLLLSLFIYNKYKYITLHECTPFSFFFLLFCTSLQ